MQFEDNKSGLNRIEHFSKPPGMTNRFSVQKQNLLNSTSKESHK